MRRSTWKRLVSGTFAGLAGSALMQAMQVAGKKWLPDRMPPLRQDPGEFMVEKAEQILPLQGDEVPELVEKTAVKALALGYGTTFAVLFAASRPRVKNVVLEGSALGLATWSAGYLGWLPVTKLMPPISRQKSDQVLGSIASHILFGIATVFGIATAALYREVRRRL